jgi:two-component system response regulator HupR/HoxA
MAATVAEARHLASFDIPVLLTGPAGSGKAALAQAIHGASLRADRPYLALDLPACRRRRCASSFAGCATTGPPGGPVSPAPAGGRSISAVSTRLDRTRRCGWRVSCAAAKLHRQGATEAQRLDLRLICGSATDLRLAVAEGARSGRSSTTPSPSGASGAQPRRSGTTTSRFWRSTCSSRPPSRTASRCAA